MLKGCRTPVFDLVGADPVHPRMTAGVVGHKALAVFIGERLGHFQHQLVAHVFSGLQSRRRRRVVGEIETVDMYFSRAANVQFPGARFTVRVL